MIRFFVEPQDISNGMIQLNAEDMAHVRSLRLRPDEQFIVCDGAGHDHICRLGRHLDSPQQNENSLPALPTPVAEVIETRLSQGEPTIKCSVYIALAKGDRLEYAVQKSVELGVYDIVLFTSERCVSTPDDLTKKILRLQRIALETAKQCGRGRVPIVSAIGSFSDAIKQAARAGLPLFFYECESEQHLKQVLEQRVEIGSVSIVTGPEGGFEPHEAEFARSAGMVTVTLGARILRSETAPAAALAALMFFTNNF